MLTRPSHWAVLSAAPQALMLLLRLRHWHRHYDVPELVELLTPVAGIAPWTINRAAATAWAAWALVRRWPSLFPQPCLYRGLATYHYLRCAGLPVVLQVGVRSEAGELLSHAWVLLDGAPWPPEPGIKDFRPMVTYPSTSFSDL